MAALDDLEPPSSVPAFGADPSPALTRWELYRLLADPVRVRLLALAAAEELGVGELAELLNEGQPKVSRHAAALRDAGLLAARRQGTWTLLRLAPDAGADPVVADAIGAGTQSCRNDGTLARIERVLTAREKPTRDFFARGQRPLHAGPPPELGAYLAALAPLLPDRHLAVDVGTGDGPLLEVLAPIYHHVIAVDRAPAQLSLAAERTRVRGLSNVTLVEGEIDGPEIAAAIANTPASDGPVHGADLIFASRVLHHAKAPARALQALAGMLRPPSAGRRAGVLAILDYETHEDAAFGSDQADLWLGFAPAELCDWAEEAGLEGLTVRRLPSAWCGEGPDRHLPWQLVIGHRSADREVDTPPSAAQTPRRSHRKAAVRGRSQPRSNAEPELQSTQTPDSDSHFSKT